MTKKTWFKGAMMIMAAGTLLAGGGFGCLQAVVQRILVANVFD